MIDLEDEELFRKARNASNGAPLERLWEGDALSYDSHSEADMAPCWLFIARLHAAAGTAKPAADGIELAEVLGESLRHGTGKHSL